MTRLRTFSPVDKREVLARIEVGETKLVYSTKDMGFKQAEEILIIHKGQKIKIAEFDSRFESLRNYVLTVMRSIKGLKALQ